MANQSSGALILGAMDDVMNLSRMVAKDMIQDPAWNQRLAEQRYLTFHRGNPMAIAEFAALNAPRGENPLKAAADYEESMERSLVQRGVLRG